MKGLAVILIIFMSAFTTKPLLHEMMHSHLHAIGAAHQCSSCNHEENQEDSPGDHQDHHAGLTDCHCAFSASTPFHLDLETEVPIESSPTLIISTYLSGYTYSCPDIIWHPPQVV